MRLRDPFGREVPGVPTATTDAEGRFALEKGETGRGYLVEVALPQARMTTLTRPAEVQPSLAVDPASTVVTAFLRRKFIDAPGTLGEVSMAAFGELVASVRPALEAQPVAPDLSTTEAAALAYDALVKPRPELAAGGEGLAAASEQAARDTIANGTIEPEALRSAPPLEAAPATPTPSPMPTAIASPVVGTEPSPAPAPAPTPVPSASPAASPPSSVGGPRISTWASGLGHPTGVAADDAGNLYVADADNLRIQRIDAKGVVTTSASNAPFPVPVWFGGPQAVAWRAGALYVADIGFHCVRKIANGVTTTVAGYGYKGVPNVVGDGGAAVRALLIEPRGVAVDGAGRVYIAEAGRGRIRRVTNGIIGTIAGGGTQELEAGPGAGAKLLQPRGIVLDRDERYLYVADALAHVVRRVDLASATFETSVIAGTGQRGSTGDHGPARQALLDEPSGLALGPDGSLYVSDARNHSIRRILPEMNIVPFAGGAAAGYTGDGGPALTATFNGPVALAFDASGRLAVADQANNALRVIP